MGVFVCVVNDLTSSDVCVCLFGWGWSDTMIPMIVLVYCCDTAMILTAEDAS